MIFDETLTFTNKQLTDSTLKIQVYDQDTLKDKTPDNLLGEYDLNLNLQNLREEDDESKVARLRSAQRFEFSILSI